MKKLMIGGKVSASAVSLGCMRIAEKTPQEADRVIKTALEGGIDFFDHADVYGSGKCEEMFGNVISETPSLREKILVQSKCGLYRGMYNFSRDYILKQVDGSLKRLKTDYLDFLLLHRPDTLMEPEEVAEAFTILRSSGKVRYFGVSNQRPMQMQLLEKYLDERLLVNQIQFSLCHTGIIDSGIHVNMEDPPACERDGQLLEYCRFKDITIQAWSPFQYGYFGGSFIGHEKYAELNKVLERLAEQYHATPAGIACAWILRHPAGIQPVIGTMNPQRIREIADASSIRLTREEWYELYKAAGNRMP